MPLLASCGELNAHLAFGMTSVQRAALPTLASEACDRLRQGFIARPDLRRIRRAVESALCVGTSTDEASR